MRLSRRRCATTDTSAARWCCIRTRIATHRRGGQASVKRAALKAGVFNNGPHMLRHTFCSHLAMRGAPARAIHELAGHQNLTTTQRYMHLSPAALDTAIRLLERRDREKFRGDMILEAGILKIGSLITRMG